MDQNQKWKQSNEQTFFEQFKNVNCITLHTHSCYKMHMWKGTLPIAENGPSAVTYEKL